MNHEDIPATRVANRGPFLCLSSDIFLFRGGCRFCKLLFYTLPLFDQLGISRSVLVGILLDRKHELVLFMPF